jgi:hypothetical protein
VLLNEIVSPAAIAGIVTVLAGVGVAILPRAIRQSGAAVPFAPHESPQ